MKSSCVWSAVARLGERMPHFGNMSPMFPSIQTAAFIQAAARERVLFWCLLASLALHALILISLSVGGVSAPPTSTLLALTARLGPLAASPPRTSLPPQPEPIPTQRPVLTQPADSPAPRPQELTPAETAKAASTEPAQSAPITAAATAPPAAPVETKPGSDFPGGVPSATPTAKSSTDATAGTIEQYRLALIVAARRYKRYPSIALEKGWQGRAEVRMVIGENGMIASASIKSGSGYEILDSQALDMIRKGKTTVPIPAGLRGREFSVDVPVIFSLDIPNT